MTKATTNLVKTREDVPQKLRFFPNAGFAIRSNPPILMRWPWAQSQLRYGNGRAGRNLQARRCVDSAADLHDALSPAQAESSTMRWRKKLYDALTVRNKGNVAPIDLILVNDQEGVDHVVPELTAIFGCRGSARPDHGNLEFLPIRSTKDQPRVAGHDPSFLEAANGRFVAVI